MNKAKLIELARKAQLQYGSDEEPLVSVVKFAELVRADEREACAKVCEDEIKRVKPIYSVVAENALKAIRARGEKPWVKTYSEGKPVYTTPEEPKPVAWRWKELVNGEVFNRWEVTSCEPPPYAVETQPLYTAPRQWQGLTDEEIEQAWASMNHDPAAFVHFAGGALWAEAKMKEKNA